MLIYHHKVQERFVIGSKIPPHRKGQVKPNPEPVQDSPDMFESPMQPPPGPSHTAKRRF